MKRIRQTFRFAHVIVLIFSFLTVSSFVWLIVRERWRRTRAWSKVLTFMCRWGCWILRIKVHPIDEARLQDLGNALFAGNHLSYLDVLIIASRFNTCFVTSVEIRETPLLGQICQLAGCLFVERRSRTQLHKEIGELKIGLDAGLNVTIFPEATSTNGEQILRFRRPLFLSAIQAKKPVVPICLNYKSLGQEKLTLKNRDLVFWYGDMPFASHLWEICGLDSINVDLVFLPPIPAGEEEEPGNVAAQSQAAVESVFQPVGAAGQPLLSGC